MRVLVVDGDTRARERTRAALAEHYGVQCATGVREALAALHDGDLDFVVSEIDLQDGDGLALCERLRALPQCAHVPIMLLTARTSIHDKIAGFQAGADDYVVKPIDTRHFYARVRLLCRIKGLERPRDIGA